MRIKTVMRSELKRVLPFLGLGVLAILACLFQVNVQVAEYLDANNLSLWAGPTGGNLVGTILADTIRLVQLGITAAIVVMILFQFMDVKKGKTPEFMQSIPVKRSTWFWCRYLVGVVTITIPTLIGAVGACIIKAVHQSTADELNALANLHSEIKGNDTYGSIWLLMFILWMELLAIYSVLFAAQICVHSLIGATIIGALTLGVPFLLVTSCDNYITSYLYQATNVLANKCYYWERVTSGVWSGTNHVIFDVRDQMGISLRFLQADCPGSAIWFWIAVTVAAMVFAWVVWRTYDYAHGDWKFANIVVERIFLVCLGLCVGLLATNMYHAADVEVYWIVFVISWLLVSVFGFVLCKRMRRGER